jgi:hypothetical protein
MALQSGLNEPEVHHQQKHPKRKQQVEQDQRKGKQSKPAAQKNKPKNHQQQQEQSSAASFRQAQPPKPTASRLISSKSQSKSPRTRLSLNSLIEDCIRAHHLEGRVNDDCVGIDLYSHVFLHVVFVFASSCVLWFSSRCFE